MKRLLTGAAMAAALIAPGVASADTGSVGAHYGNIDVGTSDADLYGLDLNYNHDFSNGWTVQGSATSDRLDAGGGSTAGIGNIDIAAGVRNDNHAVYGFVGQTNLFFGDSLNLGVGGQMYLPRATLNGSLGYADFDGGSATNVHVDGTYFFTDNFGVTGDLGYIDFDSGSLNIYGVGATYRFAGSPVSLDAGYQVADGDSGDVDFFRLGFNINFGTETAREQSQSGASFNGGRRLYGDILGAL